MTFPNGIALSPDEKTLYVANSDPRKAIWMAFPVKDDGTIGAGQAVRRCDELSGNEEGAARRNESGCGRQPVSRPGPAAFWCLPRTEPTWARSATGQATANCGWGEDGSVLYITADMFIGRVRLTTKGKGF